MKIQLAVITMALLVAGCASYSPVPEGYAGPTATIKDSTHVLSGSKVEFFYLDEVDAHRIDNSRSASLSSSRGMGMQMRLKSVSRAVPITPQTLTIVGRTEYAAPILAFTNDVFQVKGTLHITPEAGKTYVVKGVLRETGAEVWLENEETQQIVGEKIKSTGSAKLGLLEK